jgi:hypothetical protein
MNLGFNTIEQKTTFSLEFSNQIVNGTSQKTKILAAMKTAYEGSTIAADMFDNWIINNPGSIQTMQGLMLPLTLNRPKTPQGIGIHRRLGFQKTYSIRFG